VAGAIGPHYLNEGREIMRRWAAFILRHRRAVVASCGVVLVAGIALAGKTTSRLTVDFSLPGQPGSQTSDKINQAFGNGGKHVISGGGHSVVGQTITGHEAQVAKAFDAVATSVPGVRVIDEANAGDKPFCTKDARTHAFALVFYRFNPSPSQQGVGPESLTDRSWFGTTQQRDVDGTDSTPRMLSGCSRLRSPRPISLPSRAETILTEHFAVQRACNTSTANRSARPTQPTCGRQRIPTFQRRPM
jgi:hypothetical protein